MELMACRSRSVMANERTAVPSAIEGTAERSSRGAAAVREGYRSLLSDVSLRGIAK
jgi:hypothetical protein